VAQDTIVDRFLRQGQQQPNRPAIWYNVHRTWKNYTWAEYVEAARAFAGALLSLGFPQGGCTVIMGNNSPQWLIADVGTMIAGGSPAGIYQTSTREQARYIAGHCEAFVWVVEDLNTYRAAGLDEGRGDLKALVKIVMVRDADKIDDPDVISFEDFLELGQGMDEQVKARVAQIRPEQLATLIYTSGTTGPPKGVMLSHDNLAFTASKAVSDLVSVDPDDCIVSYLPLSHIAEQMFSLHIPITAGCPVWCCDDMSKVKDTLIIARPTVFLAVPRVWEKFKTALEGKFREVTGPKAKIAAWAQSVGLEAGQVVFEKGESALPLPLKLQYTASEKLFASKLRAALGMDRLRVAVSGAAPIGKDVLEFFLACGIPIHEVYGQSEGSGPSTFNFPSPGKRRIGSVGIPFPDTEVKIAEDGEILVRGRNVFLGYFKNQADTDETLQDGWLHSGDIGRFDDQGFLYITDRKKDLIITAGGKNVAPQNIEKLLRNIDGVAQAVVIGDRRKFLTALLTLDAERAPALARERGWPDDLHALAKHGAFESYVSDEVERINTGLARYEGIKRHAILPVDFSVESGELTPTQKIKRKIVNDNYRDVIEGFYDGLE
jgi:long-chain acyl-CoA synthetase